MFTILLSFQIIYPWDVCLVESRLYHLWHQVELRGGFWFLAHMSMNWSIKSRELLCIKPTYYFYQIILRKSLFQETFYFWLNSCDNHPLRHKRIKQVLHLVLHGWPHNKVEEELKPYFMRRDMLTFVYFGDSPQAPETVLKTIHEDHSR